MARQFAQGGGPRIAGLIRKSRLLNRAQLSVLPKHSL
jgi:hypothetical protein